MDIDIIPYSSAHESHVAELASRVFGESVELNARYMRWKYQENPYLIEPCMHVAVAGGKVVGMRGAYGSRWRFGSGRSWLMPTAGDLAVDEPYRGLWIAQRLVVAGQDALAARGFAYSLSTSAAPTTRLLRLHAGSRLAAKYEYFYLGAAQRFARQSTDSGGPGLRARLMHRIRNRLRKTFKSDPLRKFDKWAKTVAAPYEISSSADYSALGELASRFGDESVFHHVRDEEFYRWRLQDPRHRFRFVIYKPGRVAEGFLIVQQKSAGGPLMISDWATRTTEIWTNLLQFVCACDTGEIQIASTNFPPEYLRQIEEIGFVRRVLPSDARHGEPGILIDSVSDSESNSWMLDGQDLLSSNKWDMRMIYSDAF